MICAAGVTNRSSLVNVMRSHSSAMAAGASVWSQASRPNAYQFAWANGWPHQLRASPVLATAAMPPVR